MIDIDPNSTDFNKVVSIIDAGPKPFGINITPDGTRAYVTFFYCTYTLTRECRIGVRVIDTETDTWIDTIEDIGLLAYIIAFTPDVPYLWDLTQSFANHKPEIWTGCPNYPVNNPHATTGPIGSYPVPVTGQNLIV